MPGLSHLGGLLFGISYLALVEAANVITRSSLCTRGVYSRWIRFMNWTQSQPLERAILASRHPRFSVRLVGELAHPHVNFN